jgi:hypothetical protein
MNYAWGESLARKITSWNETAQIDSTGRTDVLGAATGEGLRDGSSQTADESEVVPDVAVQSLA